MFLDLYPFSVFPMFSDNTSQYVVIEINDSDGNELRAADYGLRALLLANHSQRYGLKLGPCYFDNHEKIQMDRVQSFLASNFPDQQYPIVIRHWSRGFDQTTRTIKNLTEPDEFRIEHPSVGIATGDAKPDSLDAFSNKHDTEKSNDQASNQQGAIR